MTHDDHKKLQDLLSEYGHSLERMAGERDLLKAIENRATLELGMEAKTFKTVATALWKDAARQTRETLQEQIDLFDRVLGPVTFAESVKDFSASLNRAGATVTFE